MDPGGPGRPAPSGSEEPAILLPTALSAGAERNTTPLRTVMGRTIVLALIGHAISLVVLAIVMIVLNLVVQPHLDDLRAAWDEARDSHDGMLDQQTGVRAYLATDEDVFLEAYENGRAAVDGAEDDLIRHVAGEDELLTSVLSVGAAQRAWADQWAAAALSGSWVATADTNANGDVSSAELAEYLRGGKALFDEYRAAAAELETEIRDRVDASEHTYRVLLLVATGLLAANGVVSVVVLLRSRRRLQRSVLGPVADLTDAAARVERGDLQHAKIPGSEVQEFNDLAAGLEVMTTRLAERAAVAADREEELVRRSNRLHHVLDLSRELSESLSLRYTTLRLISAVEELSGAAEVELWLHQHGRQELVRYDPNGGAAETIALTPEEDGGSDRVEVGIGAVGRAARYGRAIPLDERRTAQIGDEPQQGVAIPMVIGAQVIGVLTLEATEGAFLDLDLLDALILQGSTALQAARLHGEVEERSRSDALTGLANRRQFDEDLASNVARAARYGRPLSLVMIDLDHFKRINDTYGHARGDEVLQDVAGLIMREIRDADVAYRYGGEELCILMPETGADTAAELADRLRGRVAGSFPWATDSPVSLSAGVAELGDAREGAFLVGAADRALYAAKRGGRDRVEISAPA